MDERRIQKRHVLSAVALCAFFWAMDALLDGLLFPERYSSGFSFAATPRELWMRTVVSVLVGCVFLFARWRAQWLRHTERVKRRADELSRVLFESATDAICLIDSRDVKVTAVNTLFLKRHALTEDDALGQSLYDLISMRRLPADALAPLEETAITGEPATCDLAYPGDDGELVYEEVATYPIGDPGLGTSGALYVTRDVTTRRRSEELVRNSEERYRAIFDNTGTAMAIVHAGGVIRMVNRGFEEVTGYGKEELEGRLSWNDLVPEPALQLPCAALEGALPRSFELALLDKGGVEKTVAGNWSSIAGSEETVVSLLDITGQKRVEKALRESRAALAVAQRIAHMGNWEWDVVLDELTWSEEMFRIYGLPSGEIAPTYEGRLQAVHPQDRELVIKAMNAALYDKTPLELDYRIVLPTGETRTIACRGEVSYDRLGNPLRIIGTDQDVTWRKEAEEALRISEEKFSKAFRASPDPIAIMRAEDCAYIDVNEAFLKTTGYSAEELIGHTSSELQLWAEPEARIAMLKILNRYGHVRNLDVRFRMKSGEIRQLLWSADIIEYRGEGCLIAISRDVTEQRQLEKELHESEAKLFMKHEELKSLFQQMESIRREWEETMDCVDDMFILADGSGKIRRFNRAVETFSGKPHRDIVGTEWSAFLETQGMAPHLAAPGTEIYHAGSGRWFVLHSYSFSMNDVDGALRQVIIINDTTKIGRKTPEIRVAGSKIAL
ncbi:PAS domain S-box protein [Geomonas sp. RF6]|uniref:PAS domain-containing protein n=1 Tax=Geomonas sp. RF6 TaxID=2897342 RepID=UPI001E41182C|nr:PAS domain-containing protein [Geomonas sp. RF6]UFS71590.1 PAS domain S-box protein [Geomonas sp. RF6]